MSDGIFGFHRERRRPIDLNDLPSAPSEPEPAKEAAALHIAEKRGYVSRDPGEGQGSTVLAMSNAAIAAQKEVASVTRRRGKIAQATRSVLIKGPEDEINEFIKFANDGGYSSYWLALRDLLARAKAAQ